MGLFSFAESPQLQALLADIAQPTIRDASFALYFTLAFGVGSLWTAVYGPIIEAAGEATGLPIVFGLMAASFLVGEPDGPAGPRGDHAVRSRRDTTAAAIIRRALYNGHPVGA